MAPKAAHTELTEGYLAIGIDTPGPAEKKILNQRHALGATDPALIPREPTYRTMAVSTESFLHLSRPLAPASLGVQPTTAPLNVIIQPQVSYHPRSQRKTSLTRARLSSPSWTMQFDATTATHSPHE